ncbi:hypothetical protein SGLAM104S_08027 [Streptomyces glaucescens]
MTVRARHRGKPLGGRGDVTACRALRVDQDEESREVRLMTAFEATVSGARVTLTSRVVA